MRTIIKIKAVKSFILLMGTMLLCTACDDEKGYSILFGDNYAYVIMRSPTFGISGINAVDYDGFTPSDIEKEIFDHIRSEDIDSQSFSVIVSLETKDKYGNYVVLSENSDYLVSKLEVAEVRRYADFRYFRQEIGIESKLVTGRRCELRQNHHWKDKYLRDMKKQDEESRDLICKIVIFSFLAIGVYVVPSFLE